MEKQIFFYKFKNLKGNIFIIYFSSFCIGLLILFLTSSCSNEAYGRKTISHLSRMRKINILEEI